MCVSGLLNHWHEHNHSKLFTPTRFILVCVCLDISDLLLGGILVTNSFKITQTPYNLIGMVAFLYQCICSKVGGNQDYSRLSTTHGHVTDCKLDSLVYAGVCVVI